MNDRQYQQAARLSALNQYHILDTEPEAAFDDIARLAMLVCGTPVALINFIDGSRQWFKSNIGLDVKELPLVSGFCRVCVEESEVVIVPDTLANEQLATHSLVQNYPYIRFYAGAPLIVPDGNAIGTLCAVDTKPREISAEQVEALAALSRQVVNLLELRRHITELENAIAKYQVTEAAIQQANETLELKVQERTALLQEAIEQLEAEIKSRVRVEETLNKEQEFLKALLENLADGIVACDENGILTLFNRATRKFHGMPQQPLPPEEWAQSYTLYLPDGCTPMQKEDIPLFQALQGKTVRNVEMVIAPKQGKVRTLLANGQAIVTPEGKKLGAVIAMHDITTRKAIEAALVESESRLNSILNSIQDAVWSIAFDSFEVLYLNPATEKLHTRSRQDFFDNPRLWYEVIHPDDRDSLENYMKQLLETGSLEYQYRIIRADGEVRWAQNKGWLVYDSAGKPIRIDGLASDITEQKLAQEALRQSQAFLAESQKVARVGCWEFTPATQAVTWSEELCRIFGLQPSSTPLTYEGYLQKIYPDDVETIKQAVELAISQGIPYEFDQRILLPDGSYRYVSAKGQPIFNEKGEVTQIFGTTLDISDRKAAEDKIKASLQEKETLLKEIHHRVKNNLQIISSLLRLQSKQIRDVDVLELFQESQNRVRTMALIHEKLYQSDNLAKIDFLEYVQTLLQELFRSYGTSRQAIAFHLDIEKVHLEVDLAIPCGLIINELVTNCLKYAFPDGKAGEIKINLIRDGQSDRFILSISDNGIGLPEDLDFRETQSLGLQLVCRLTKQLGGSINLTHRQGTTFQIIFTSPND